MSELPPSWSVVPLVDAVDILDSKRVPVNAKERAERLGAVPYYGATGQVGWIDESLFDEELVLLGEDGAPFLDARRDKAYLISGPSWVNNHAHVLRARQGVTTNRFLKHYLNVVDFQQFVTGTTRLKLPQGPMKRIPLPLPPLPEQHRIVEVIEEQFSRLDAGVASLQRAKRNLERMRASVLSAAVEGSDCEWPETSVGELLGRISAGKSFRAETRPARGDEWGVIKVSAMTWGAFKAEENKAIPADREPDPRLEIKPGDLLLSRANTSAYVGATVLVGTTRPRLLLSDKSMRLEPKPNVDKRWLQLALSSPPLRRQMSAVATGTSDSMRNISQDKVRELRVKKPTTTEQQQVVAEVERKFSILDSMEAAVDAGLARAVRLRQSILREAFAGRLVQQDPADEPASALLERIQSERTKT